MPYQPQPASGSGCTVRLAVRASGDSHQRHCPLPAERYRLPWELHPQPGPEESGSFHVARWVFTPFLSPSPESPALAMGLPEMGGALLGAHSNVTAGPMGQARGPSGLWLKPWIGGQHLGLSLGLGTAQRMDHVAGKSSSLPAASIHSPWPRNPAREAQPFPRTQAGAGSPVTTGKGIVAAESKLNTPQENPPAPARGPGQAVSPSLGADP